MSIERGPRNQELTSGDQIEIPAKLQSEIDALEAMKAKSVPDWYKKENEENLKRKQEEIDSIIEGIKMEQQRRAINKDTIEQNLGKETLSDIESASKRIGDSFEEYLSRCEGTQESNEIIELWREFSDALINASRMEKGQRFENALKAAIKQIHGATRK